MNGWIDMVLRKHSSPLKNLCTQTLFQVVTARYRKTVYNPNKQDYGNGLHNHNIP